MAVTEGFKRFVLAQLAELGDVTPRAMFGGVGLYCGGWFFAILAADQLYLKVNDDTRPAFEKAGMKPFKPFADRAGTMQYYQVPVEVLESASELEKWARRAVAVARH